MTNTGWQDTVHLEGAEEQSQFLYRPPAHNPGPPRQWPPSDPLMGYRFSEQSRVLNDSWVVNLRSTRPLVDFTLKPVTSQAIVPLIVQ